MSPATATLPTTGGPTFPPKPNEHPDQLAHYKKIEVARQQEADAALKVKRIEEELAACLSPLAAAVARVLGAGGIDIPTTKKKLEQDLETARRQHAARYAEVKALIDAGKGVSNTIRADVTSELWAIVTPAVDEVFRLIDAIEAQQEILRRAESYQVIALSGVSPVVGEIVKLLRAEMVKARVRTEMVNVRVTTSR